MKPAAPGMPRRPLLWLAVALLFTAPPMFFALLPLIPSAFVLALIARLWMERRRLRLRSVAWKIAGALGGVGLVYASYGSLKGLEPGMSVLLVLVSLKILEAHSARDFHILAMLGWFLCLGALFVSQNLATALYALVAFALLLAAVVEFHLGGTGRRPLLHPLKMAGTLLLQALPLLVLLFFLFPRGSAGFRLLITRASAEGSGMSDHLTPGRIASLALSDEVAFRAEFPDGNVPSASALYWRGAVMWQGNGLEWRAGTPPGVWRSARQNGGEPIRQRIVIEPHGDQWMFALDRPVVPPPGVSLHPGNYLRSPRAIHSSRRYEVTSLRQIREPELRGGEERAALALPETVSAELHALVQTWTASSPEPRAVVQRALQHFRREKFHYSLSPGEYAGGAALDDFLFRRRIGFCEHYAAAFATLMRVAGIPSRVVVGYQGGQWNQFGGYLVVRQSDAHAWCEVWIPGAGWERVDPTGAVSPERVNLGFASFMQRSAAGANAAGATFSDSHAALGRQQFLTDLRLAWDSVNYAWDTRVLNFDEDAQRNLWAITGMGGARPLAVIARLAVVAGMVVCAYAAIAWLKTRPAPDRLRALYERFCRRVARLGVRRDAAEGPGDFAARAAASLPHYADAIRRIANAYVKLRYERAPAPGLAEEFAREVKAFRRRAPRRPSK